MKKVSTLIVIIVLRNDFITAMLIVFIISCYSLLALIDAKLNVIILDYNKTHYIHLIEISATLVVYIKITVTADYV